MKFRVIFVIFSSTIDRYMDFLFLKKTFFVFLFFMVVISASAHQLINNATTQYVKNINIYKIENEGLDYANYKYNLNYIKKNFNTELKKAELELRGVDRHYALQMLFKKITANTKNNQEKYLRVLDFLQKSAVHVHYTPIYKENGQAVYDPLVLLKIHLMQYGQVNRVAADLFSAAGYKTRILQLNGHVIAEIKYSGDWHYFDADMFRNKQVVLLNGKIPSIDELSYHPQMLDKFQYYPQLYLFNSTAGCIINNIYPSYFYFGFNKSSEMKYNGRYVPYYYVKTATLQQAKNSIWYGWNYYKQVPDLLRQTYSVTIHHFPRKVIFTSIKITKKYVILHWKMPGCGPVHLKGYHIYISTHSRGWNYFLEFTDNPSIKKYWNGGSWNPSMYNKLTKLPPHDVALITTKKRYVKFKLPSNLRSSFYLSVMPFDQYGQSVGLKTYPASYELKFHE